MVQRKKAKILSGPWHLGIVKDMHLSDLNTEEDTSFKAASSIISVSMKHFKSLLFCLFWNFIY